MSEGMRKSYMLIKRKVERVLMSTQTERKVNLESPTNKADIAAIKTLLARGYNESEIGLQLGVTNETISRKISAWSKTSDFTDWIAEVWLTLYVQVASKNPVEAFRQVNRLFCQLIIKRPDSAEAIREIQVSWLGPNESVQQAEQGKSIDDDDPDNDDTIH